MPLQDEQGVVLFSPGVKSVTHSKYGKSGDYEACGHTERNSGRH